MATLKIKIPKKAEKTMIDLIELLGGRVLPTDSKKQINKKKKKEEILKGLEESIEFVKLHQQGKVKAKSIDEFLNEL